MKKKKQQAKKSKTTTKKISASKKRAAAKVKAAPKKKAVSKKAAVKPVKRTSKGGVERREFRRVTTSNLWVTELNGEYQFVAQARDISEGGIFLQGRLKTSQAASILKLQINGQPLELMAQPIYDQVSQGAYGTGYRFIEMSVSQAKSLRGLISAIR